MRVGDVERSSPECSRSSTSKRIKISHTLIFHSDFNLTREDGGFRDEYRIFLYTFHEGMNVVWSGYVI